MKVVICALLNVTLIESTSSPATVLLLSSFKPFPYEAGAVARFSTHHLSTMGKALFVLLISFKDLKCKL